MDVQKMLIYLKLFKLRLDLFYFPFIITSHAVERVQATDRIITSQTSRQKYLVGSKHSGHLEFANSMQDDFSAPITIKNQCIQTYISTSSPGPSPLSRWRFEMSRRPWDELLLKTCIIDHYKMGQQ